MFYDDTAMLTEDVDSKLLYGCQSNVVLGGKSPKDYDGRELINAQDSSSIPIVLLETQLVEVEQLNRK
jgi:hypothetical protein